MCRGPAGGLRNLFGFCLQNTVNMCRRPAGGLRNLVGFWCLGLCNNFSYVIMLSAAHDILRQSTGNGTHSKQIHPPSNETNNSSYLKCNKFSTAAILLADILPALIVKLLTPLYINLIGYRIKVLLVMGFAAASFIIVGLVESITFSILGVVCASISSGLGEPVFLGLSAHFHRNVISAWSSGTGGAGLFGALAYASLTQAGVSPRTAVLLMLVITVWMGISYFIVLKKPTHQEVDNSQHEYLIVEDSQENRPDKLSPRQKIRILPSLMKYMLPLSAVYFAEYFINQGLLELLYFNNLWLTPQDQYRWYQVDYQLGVFISRSSVNFFHFKHIWIMPILQTVNAALLLSQVFVRFMPSFWIIMALVLYEGMIGGAAYVNTFYKMHSEIPEEQKEYSLSMVSVADSFGICVSGAVSIPAHNAICGRRIKM